MTRVYRRIVRRAQLDDQEYPMFRFWLECGHIVERGGQAPLTHQRQIRAQCRQCQLPDAAGTTAQGCDFGPNFHA